jgi:hypothetical protein
MSTIDDLAALLAHRRAELERTFSSEILRLKAAYGAGAVEEALAISRGERWRAIPIGASHPRQHRDRQR